MHSSHHIITPQNIAITVGPNFPFEVWCVKLNHTLCCNFAIYEDLLLQCNNFNMEDPPRSAPTSPGCANSISDSDFLFRVAFDQKYAVKSELMRSLARVNPLKLTLFKCFVIETLHNRQTCKFHKSACFTSPDVLQVRIFYYIGKLS